MYLFVLCLLVCQNVDVTNLLCIFWWTKCVTDTTVRSFTASLGDLICYLGIVHTGV